MLDKELPEEFAFLHRRKAQLKRELAEIEAMEANLLETRQLLDRTMNMMGSLTRAEWANSQTAEYQRRFLDGNLAFSNEELNPKSESK